MDFTVSFVSTGYFLHQRVRRRSRQLHEEPDHDNFESMRSWVRSEIRGNNYKAIAEASKELMIYDTREHLSYVEAPTTVLITTKDEAFSLAVQEEMADRIRGATRSYYQGGHLSCLKGEFHQHFVEVCAQMHRHAK